MQDQEIRVTSADHVRTPAAERLRAFGAMVLMLAIGCATVMLAPSPASASITNTRVDAWGTLELSGSGWLNGGGVDVYSNGATAAGPSPDTWNYVTNINGVSTQSGIMWQCVELINRLYLSRGWITARWQGNGNQLYGNAPANLSKQPNGSIAYLNPGDVVTLDDGGLGHAGIVNTVSGTSVQIVNQNTMAVYSTATFSGGTLTMNGWSGYTVQGVIHAPTSGTGLPTLMRSVGSGNTQCMDLTSYASFTPVTLYPCYGGVSQQWSVRADGTIRSVGSGNTQCMDLGSYATGTRITLYPCSAVVSQRWYLAP